MPFFDYKCACCGAVREELVKHHTDEVLCRWCNEPMTKLVSAPPRYRDHTVNDGMAPRNPPDTFRPIQVGPGSKNTRR